MKEPALLMSMNWIVGRIQIQNDLLPRFRMRIQKLIHHHPDVPNCSHSLNATRDGLFWSLLQFVFNFWLKACEKSGLKFVKSPSATAFSNSIWDGIDATFADAAQRFGRKLVEKARSRF